jgi:hypothetical protein
LPALLSGNHLHGTPLGRRSFPPPHPYLTALHPSHEFGAAELRDIKEVRDDRRVFDVVVLQEEIPQFPENRDEAVGPQFYVWLGAQ